MLGQVHCRFDFSDSRDALEQVLPREYRNPLRVLAARTPTECRSVLAEAEAELSAGRHVAGFISYEAAGALNPVLRVHGDRLQDLPLLQFGVFDKALPAPGPADAGAATVPQWSTATGPGDHATAIGEIRRLISAGDTYQVNHTIRLRSRLEGEPDSLYGQLRAAQPAAWSAFIDIDRHQLLSCSPELFFLRRGQKLVTRPMKGTTRRSSDYAEDVRLRRELQESAKERAENVMITDLLRNDLGMVATPGSVTVDRLLEVESHPTFHALTSTVSAVPADGAGLAQVMEALFPCGSVTGAPKVRTMEIINSLEPEPRGVYCGTMGFADPDGTWAFNVAIRTVQHRSDSGELVYGTGGGITWDSIAEAEHAEALLKASFLPGSPAGWRNGKRP